MRTPEEWLLAEDDKRFVYALNEQGTNIFWASFDGGQRDDKRTSREELEANAQFVVKAHKHFDALVAACKELLEVLVPLVGDEKCDHNVGICWCGTFGAIERANEALAAVEKE